MTATKGCFLTAAAAALVLLTIRACRPTPPEEVTKTFPIGSRLVDLDPYLKQTNLSSGDVFAWQPSPDAGTKPKFYTDIGKYAYTDFGTFKKLEPVAYDGWRAGPQEREKFTGEIIFSEHRFTYAYIVALYYRDGKLWKADWGFLPG
jgi:hypothetical protein